MKYIKICNALVIKFLLFELIPGIFFTNLAAISDNIPVTHRSVAIIKIP